MKCDECGSSIQGSYFEKDGKTICKKDYDEKYRKKCSVCKEYIEGTYFTKDEEIYCAKDYKKLNGDVTDCKKCGKKVRGEIIRAVGHVYHPDCFKCCVCDRDLGDNNKKIPFLTDDKHNLYCQPDYHEKFAPRCCACKKPIAPSLGEETTPRLTAFDKEWHPECFKCVDCDLVLDGSEGKKCYPKNETPLCMDCNRKRD